MQRSLLDPIGGRKPARESISLVEAVEAAYHVASMPGNEAQKALLSKLKDRTGIVGGGGSFDVPDSICRGGPAGIQQRVMAEGFGMGPGGAAIREEYASEVLRIEDARMTLGLWDFIQWTGADSIEYIVPVLRMRVCASAEADGVD